MSQPKFVPRWHSDAVADEAGWIAVLGTAASFPLSSFLNTVNHLIYHPELNSKLILRADILYDSEDDHGHDRVTSSLPLDFKDCTWVKTVRRQLVAKAIHDGNLEQTCDVYVNETNQVSVAVLTPIVDETLSELEQEQSIPFYHPTLKSLAYVYEPTDETCTNVTCSLYIKPFRSSPNIVTDSNCRLARTLLRLLGTIHKHSTADAQSGKYEKRVNHDKVVDRITYQDLYKTLKQSYIWLVKDWQECTDPSKHVFEDIGIATWLMCLWKIMYPAIPFDVECTTRQRPWHEWGRPTGGFVDVGCGNGLLVFILHNEGYKGYGFDLRSRHSWSLFQSHGTDLRVSSFDPRQLSPSLFPTSSFLIGNHADELTPWIPIMTALTPMSCSVNIPCCLWELSDRFQTKEYKPDLKCMLSSFGIIDEQEEEEGQGEKYDKKRWKRREEELKVKVHRLLQPGTLEEVIRPTELRGRYAAYLRYIAFLTLSCGFWPEHEAMRIPSTKNIAIVARRKNGDNPALTVEQSQRAQSLGIEAANRMVDSSKSRWSARLPEGKPQH